MAREVYFAASLGVKENMVFSSGLDPGADVVSRNAWRRSITERMQFLGWDSGQVFRIIVVLATSRSKGEPVTGVSTSVMFTPSLVLASSLTSGWASTVKSRTVAVTKNPRKKTLSFIFLSAHNDECNERTVVLKLL